MLIDGKMKIEISDEYLDDIVATYCKDHIHALLGVIDRDFILGGESSEENIKYNTEYMKALQKVVEYFSGNAISKE